jgi:hypothetical protein
MKNSFSRFKTHIILSLVLLLYAFGFSPIALAAEPNDISIDAAGEPVAQIDNICSAIYKGKFANAREFLAESGQAKSPAIAQLTNIISEYEAIEKSRQSTREAAYQEQLAELEKLQPSL